MVFFLLYIIEFILTKKNPITESLKLSTHFECFVKHDVFRADVRTVMDYWYDKNSESGSVCIGVKN